MKTKIGFDVHGVLDTFPAFVAMLKTFAADPNYEVHVITGMMRTTAEEEIGHLFDLSSVTFMSIVERLMEQGVEIRWIDGLPYADDKPWNDAKADYCRETGIDIMFDDSPTYGQFFNDIDTVYSQILNPARKTYQTR